jgi:hypothetical protein
MFGNNNQIEMAERVAELVLATPGMARSEIKDGLVAIATRSGRALDCSDNTIYRWIEKAIENLWLRREGNTAGARYYPTDSLRLQWAR